MGRSVEQHAFIHLFIHATNKERGIGVFPGVWGGVSAVSLLGLRLLAGRIHFGTTTRASLPESKELTPRKGKAEKETGCLWAPQHQLITQNGISSNTSPPRLCLLEFGRKEPSEDFRMNRTHFSLEQCVGAICSEVCVEGSPKSPLRLSHQLLSDAGLLFWYEHPRP